MADEVILAALKAGFGAVPPPGPALVSQNSLPRMTQGLCVLHFGYFCSISSPAVPLAMSFLPWLSWLCQTPHCQCLPPIPACQGSVLGQCQGGEHKAPTHSEPPLHPCLLWGAEGQQIIIPCCSSLMHVFISYN